MDTVSEYSQSANKASQRKMRAWTLKEFGRANLKLDEVPHPLPGPDEALIRVRAASLNYRDKVVIEGGLLPELPSMPFTPVSDMAGEVAAIGKKVSRIKVGDRVAGNFRTSWIDGEPTAATTNPETTLGGPLAGVMADYVVMPASALVLLPDYLSFEEASALPIAALTAWMALKAARRGEEKETVLLQGTGGVSLFAMQFACAMGHEVILTSRSDDKLGRAKTLCPVQVINSQNQPDWASDVIGMTNGAGVDRIVETVGGAYVPQSLEALAIGGVISQVGFLGGVEISFPAVPLMLKHATLKGISVGDRQSFEDMLAFMTDHYISPIIDQIYSFEKFEDALDHLDRGPFGKVVIVGSAD